MILTTQMILTRQRDNLKYIFRAKWPSKVIIKETLSSFLLGMPASLQGNFLAFPLTHAMVRGDQ